MNCCAASGDAKESVQGVAVTRSCATMLPAAAAAAAVEEEEVEEVEAEAEEEPVEEAPVIERKHAIFAAPWKNLLQRIAAFAKRVKSLFSIFKKKAA
mmetsp:Transcript_26569/g.81677  ORF Transcript_26569/g.81677 Transcript_26569/m.81677 type:complete len:97 (+) Transcript_26569:251-541(+)